MRLVISPQCEADVLILSSTKGDWLLWTHLQYILPSQPRSLLLGKESYLHAKFIVAAKSKVHNIKAMAPS